MGETRVEITDNSGEVIRLMQGATVKAATEVGMLIANAAKRLCSPKGPMGNDMASGTELRNSIKSQVEEEDGTPVLSVGSDMQIAPYIELGTGKCYDPPPEWLQYNGSDGHTKGGLEQWYYYDEVEQVMRIGKPIPAQPYLRPAFLDNLDQIRQTIQDVLSEG